MPTYEYKCECGEYSKRRDMPVSATEIKCKCGKMAQRNPINQVPFKPCRGMHSYYYQNRTEANG